MKKKKYRKILKQIRKRVYRVTIQAQDEAEPHLEEDVVISYRDVMDVLSENISRKRGKRNA